MRNLFLRSCALLSAFCMAGVLAMRHAPRLLYALGQ